ncbi:hypothetical protein TeGR_g10885, partial [Tetraparma gracilis]
MASKFPDCNWHVVRLLPEVLPPPPRPAPPLPPFLLRKLSVLPNLSLLRDSVDSRTTPTPNYLSDLFSDGEHSSRVPPATADPVFLSFWLCANVPLGTRARRTLLTTRHATDRVALLQKSVASLLKKRELRLCCRRCAMPVCEKRDVFTVPGADGVCSAYVNPHGAVHQTVTVRRVQDVLLDPDPPTAQDSWFPGYAWTICYCKHCQGHLGWRFT